MGESSKPSDLYHLTLHHNVAAFTETMFLRWLFPVVPVFTTLAGRRGVPVFQLSQTSHYTPKSPTQGQ
jgi:hypothetical protein